MNKGKMFIYELLKEVSDSTETPLEEKEIRDLAKLLEYYNIQTVKELRFILEE